MEKTNGLQQLDELIASVWKEIFDSEEAKKYSSTLMCKDKRLYAIYLVQVYHYAYHTARNLGLAGANLFNRDLKLMHHFFGHALGEVGHEVMAFNDLKELGIKLDSQDEVPPALPETEIMVAYVKNLSISEKPYRCLGYHYWIEQPYNYINSFMQAMELTMGLEKKQMSFYKQHAIIDQKHGSDIQEIVAEVCKTDGIMAEIMEVTRTSLWLMFDVLKRVIQEFILLSENKSDRYAILNQIPH